MMEEKEMKEKDELFSKAVKAGKRTYFFDVKSTKNDEKYITITESKRRFDEGLQRFFYEKHKIFLYKEDFEKVSKGLTDAINYVETGEYPADYYDQPSYKQKHKTKAASIRGLFYCKSPPKQELINKTRMC